MHAYRHTPTLVTERALHNEPSHLTIADWKINRNTENVALNCVLPLDVKAEHLERASLQ